MVHHLRRQPVFVKIEVLVAKGHQGDAEDDGVGGAVGRPQRHEHAAKIHPRQRLALVELERRAFLRSALPGQSANSAAPARPRPSILPPWQAKQFIVQLPALSTTYCSGLRRIVRPRRQAIAREGHFPPLVRASLFPPGCAAARATWSRRRRRFPG